MFLSQLKRERHIVAGGGVRVLPLYQGDKIEIIDPEGLQPVHVAASDAQGYSCVACDSSGLWLRQQAEKLRLRAGMG